jgi:uncharacterized protein YidB (DUF937 family)
MERCQGISVNPIGGNAGLSTGSAAQVQQAHHHHGHGGGARKAGMDAAAQALGMSSSDLQTALKGGQSLSSLAQSKGINPDSLTKTISDAVAKANPSMSSDRAQQIAQRLVNGPNDSDR